MSVLGVARDRRSWPWPSSWSAALVGLRLAPPLFGLRRALLPLDAARWWRSRSPSPSPSPSWPTPPSWRRSSAPSSPASRSASSEQSERIRARAGARSATCSSRCSSSRSASTPTSAPSSASTCCATPAILLVVAVVGKLVSPVGAIGTRGDKLLIGLGMLPRGEVGLIFATIGLAERRPRRRPLRRAPARRAGHDAGHAAAAEVPLRPPPGRRRSHGPAAVPPRPDGGWLDVADGEVPWPPARRRSAALAMASTPRYSSGGTRPSPRRCSTGSAAAR